METERYKKNKKIPTNEDIYRFFRKYGLMLLISIGIIFIIYSFIDSSITKIMDCGDVEWNLDLSSNNSKVLYNNDIYRIDDISIYESLGQITIHLEK